MKKLLYFAGLSLALVAITSCAEQSNQKSGAAEEKNEQHRSEMNGYQKTPDAKSHQSAGGVKKGGA